MSRSRAAISRARWAGMALAAMVMAGCATAPGGDQPVPTAPLTNTYWKLVQVGEKTVSDQSSDPRSEPHMILRDDGRFNGFSGCNRFTGQYRIEDEYLIFDSVASTRESCPDDSIEEPLFDALADTAGVNLRGTSMKLLDADGSLLGEFRAIHLE